MHRICLKNFYRLFILFLFFLNSTKAFADFKVKLHFSSVANLVYQLDCITNQTHHCSKKTYEDLWQKEFSKTEEDQVYLKSWTDIRNQYDAFAALSEKKNSSIKGAFEGIQLTDKIRIASFQSLDITDFFNRLDLIVLPKDREKFEKVVRYFFPRFKKWWDVVAFPKGHSFAQKADLLLKKPEIAKKIKQFSNFYEARLPSDYTIHFNLFFRPDSEEATHGQQIENYSVAEFLPMDKPTDRIDVIIHELCHFFYYSADSEKLSFLLKKFESSEKFENHSAYNLMNETLATALGNGIINKSIMEKKKWTKYASQPFSFYNNYFVDKSAKAIMPLLEEWIDESKTLYDTAFIEKYISTLNSSFGLELTNPKLLLSEMILVADNKFKGRFRELVQKEFQAISMYSGQGDWSDIRTLQSFNELPKLSSLLIVHTENISWLSEKNILIPSHFELLKQEIKKNKKGIFSFKRSMNVPIFIIVSSEYDEALKLIVRLAELKQGFSGILSE